SVPTNRDNHSPAPRRDPTRADGRRSQISQGDRPLDSAVDIPQVELPLVLRAEDDDAAHRVGMANAAHLRMSLTRLGGVRVHHKYIGDVGVGPPIENNSAVARPHPARIRAARREWFGNVAAIGVDDVDSRLRALLDEGDAPAGGINGWGARFAENARAYVLSYAVLVSNHYRAAAFPVAQISKKSVRTTHRLSGQLFVEEEPRRPHRNVPERAPPTAIGVDQGFAVGADTNAPPGAYFGKDFLIELGSDFVPANSIGGRVVDRP